MPKKILIIDDDPVIVQYLKAVFRLSNLES